MQNWAAEPRKNLFRWRALALSIEMFHPVVPFDIGGERLDPPLKIEFSVDRGMARRVGTHYVTKSRLSDRPLPKPVRKKQARGPCSDRALTQRFQPNWLPLNQKQIPQIVENNKNLG